MDKYISGEDRSAYIVQHLDNCIMYINNNFPEGFYLPGAGEGMISASTVTAGIALMELRIATNDLCSFPVDNIDAMH